MFTASLILPDSYNFCSIDQKSQCFTLSRTNLIIRRLPYSLCMIAIDMNLWVKT